MARFEGIDFYDIESLLSEEERMVRDTIRSWVEDRLMPIIGDAYINRRFPKELIPEFGELGVLGANLPEKYGCAGLNNVAYGLIMQELERGDSGIRSFVSVQGALVMYPIYAFGSEEQRTEWLPKLATGEAIGCFCLTEPDYGSNPTGMVTRAERTGDGWRLNGAKMWITNGSMADVAVVWAQTGKIGDVADLMGWSASALGSGRADEKVVGRQEESLELLARLIEEAEQREQQPEPSPDQPSDSNPGAPQNQPQNAPSPASPAQESRLVDGESEMGQLHGMERARPGEAWGNMPPQERDRILQPIRERFPGRYRELIEQYYLQLSKDE